MAENSDRSSIKITDKRHFGSDGSRREPDEERMPAAAAASERGRPAMAQVKGEEFILHPREQGEPAGREGLPAVDFTALVLSFRTSALVHMGLVKDPSLGEGAVSAEGARQMIDILSLLQEKTAGNLNEEERRLLEQVLYELRLHFVNMSSADPRR